MTMNHLYHATIAACLVVSACGNNPTSDAEPIANGAVPRSVDAGTAQTAKDAAAPSCTKQMYAKAVNSKILSNISTVSAMNPSPIGDSFKGLSAAAVAQVEANLLDLLIAVYGGPNNYKGRDMKSSHAGLGITTAQYDAFIGQVVVPALQGAGVPQSDITSCFAPPVTDSAFVATIVERP
jgi:Bacterial-like globin